MATGPVRRAQLITPHGVGGILVLRDGTSLICAGLDYWFGGDNPAAQVEPEEFEFEEWRLQRRLQVSCFRVPPNFKRPRRGVVATNVNLSVPFLRFPRWHYCTVCRRLEQVSAFARGRLECMACKSSGKRNAHLVQVRFVAVCDRGHIRDFPWREWVHRSGNPGCTGTMRLVATGSASLSAQLVKCDCGASPRSLAGITVAATGGSSTKLTETLDKSGQPFLCSGDRPWLSDEARAAPSATLVRTECLVGSGKPGAVTSNGNFRYRTVQGDR